jgi:hypothetical protein
MPVLFIVVGLHFVIIAQLVETFTFAEVARMHYLRVEALCASMKASHHFNVDIVKQPIVSCLLRRTPNHAKCRVSQERLPLGQFWCHSV